MNRRGSLANGGYLIAFAALLLLAPMDVQAGPVETGPTKVGSPPRIHGPLKVFGPLNVAGDMTVHGPVKTVDVVRGVPGLSAAWFSEI
jgi:hypothetical protein